MIPTPAPREDGRCLTCLGPRCLTPTKLVKRTAGEMQAMLEADPFCSSTCARKFYGTELPIVVTGPRNPAKLRDANDTFQHGTENGYRRCRCHECRTAATEARRQRAGYSGHRGAAA